jgi:restriction endonuclease S subunit
MRSIVQELDGNLEEKRELTRRLLGRLDETIERAEKRYEAYSDLLEATDSTSTRDRVSLKGTQNTRESIQALLERGLTRDEVSQRLGISRGEVDLFLKLGTGSSRT